MLIDLPTWPYVLILTDEERAALERDDEVSISMFEMDPEVLRLFHGEL